MPLLPQRPGAESRGSPAPATPRPEVPMTAPRDARRKHVVDNATPVRGADGRTGDSRVPEATVARLATYLRVLGTLADRSVNTVSSDELAAVAGVNSAKLRKDLSYLGSYGI